MIPETFAFIGELAAGAERTGSKCWWRFTPTTGSRSKSPSKSTGFMTSRFRRWCCTHSTPAMRGDLKRWLEISPRNAVTVLDTHDGIGVLDVGPDRKSPEGARDC